MCYQETNNNGYRDFSKKAVVGVVIVIIVLCNAGCRAGGVLNPVNWFPNRMQPSPNPPADETGSFAALLEFAKMAYVPGVGILAISVLGGVAGAWFPPLKALADLWRLGMTLLIIGLGVAALPWGLQNFGMPAIWITLGLAVIVAGLWIWGRRKKILRGELT
jgi:hypothetical protein